MTTHNLSGEPGACNPLGAAEITYKAMCQARQEFLRTWADWLTTHPTAEEAREEFDGMASTALQIAMLRGLNMSVRP